MSISELLTPLLSFKSSIYPTNRLSIAALLTHGDHPQLNSIKWSLIENKPSILFKAPHLTSAWLFATKSNSGQCLFLLTIAQSPLFTLNIPRGLYRSLHHARYPNFISQSCPTYFNLQLRLPKNSHLWSYRRSHRKLHRKPNCIFLLGKSFAGKSGFEQIKIECNIYHWSVSP